MTEAKELSPEAKAALGTMPAAASESVVSTQATDRTVEAVADSADFGPAYRGEKWVTLTFRVPKSQAAIPGIWHLTPVGPGTRDWAKRKFPIDDA